MAALLTVACSEQSANLPSNEADGPKASFSSGSPQKPSAPAARPFSVEEENDLYSFSFSWPAEAGAVPQLVERFTRDMNETKAKLIADAKEDREERARRGFDYHAHEVRQSYETAGQSDRLLSLESSIYAFTGGAHGSSGSGTLLWDRQLAHDVTIRDLLPAGVSWTGVIREPFCTLLDREREKRRREPIRKDEMFGNCPTYDEVTVVLRDSDDNARFDHVDVIADQYVAGPYAEGDYEISLPITAAMIDRLKPEYRNSFEPRPPVK